MDWKEYWQMNRLEFFLDGFFNIKYIIDCYETIEIFPDDFWESLSLGFMQMEIFPYDDPYNRKLSKQRKMLYGIKDQPSKVQLTIQNKDFVAYTDSGYTICTQSDREKAYSCLDYYKSQNPDSIFYGSWS